MHWNIAKLHKYRDAVGSTISGACLLFCDVQNLSSTFVIKGFGLIEKFDYYFISKVPCKHRT